MIATSNINVDDCFVKVNYADLINGVDSVSDNAGLMLIKLLIDLGIKEAVLAGFDGYSYSNEQNYGENKMKLTYKKENFDALNNGMSRVIENYSRLLKLIFLTPTRLKVKSHALCSSTNQQQG